MSYREIAAKRVTSISFLSKFENCFTLVNNNMQWYKKVKLGIFDAFICKNIYMKEKYRLKIEHFLLNIGFNKSSSCQNIDTFWL